MQVLETLGINLQGFLWHTVNFLVLLFLLSRILFKPIVKILDDRAERVRESMERAEQIRAQSERDEQERLARTDEARRQVQAMLTQATTMAEQVKAEARQAAQEEARRIVERAQAEAVAERDQAMSELRQQVADLTSSRRSGSLERISIRRPTDGSLKNFTSCPPQMAGCGKRPSNGTGLGSCAAVRGSCV